MRAYISIHLKFMHLFLIHFLFLYCIHIGEIDYSVRVSPENLRDLSDNKGLTYPYLYI
jgi:hypothetical protein